jgi:hypothetical protein
MLLSACSGEERPALDDLSVRDEFGRIVEEGQVGVLRLRPGDCFIAGANQIESVTAIPCAADHDSEVVAIFDMADSTWPGATAVETAARTGCIERFESATGFVIDPSIAELTAYAPTHASWVNDRSIICVALSPDGSMIRGGLTRAGA